MMQEHWITVTRDGQDVGKLPAQGMPLHYPNMSWRADPAVGMDARGTIYAAIDLRVFASADGGKSWDSHEVDLARLAGKDADSIFGDGRLYGRPWN